MDIERYNRQIILKEIGEKGQEKLSQAKVLVVGAGGLGSSILLYLAGAGIGTLGIIDFDKVSYSNLQRQILYNQDEVGKLKVECAAKRIKSLNNNIEIKKYPYALSKENAEKIISQYDIIVDGCDNRKTRYIINDICMELNKPYIYGAISEFGGQVSVLCIDGNKNLRDIFDFDIEKDSKSNNGVIGITPGIIGIVQANQVIQIICEFGEPLINKLWIADFLSMETHIISI